MKNILVVLLVAAVFFAVSMSPQTLYAQEAVADSAAEALKAKAEADAKGEGPEDGWHINFKPAANLSYGHSKTVVGQADGSTFTFGLNLELVVTMLNGKHEWRNTVKISEAVSRTPVLGEFVISTDELFIESMYMYYFYEWFGLYGRFALETSMFPGMDVQAAPVTYAITRHDGTIDQILDDKIKLTSPFAPITLKQGLGPFFRVLNQEEVNLEFLLGLGAWETLADGELALSDNADTAEIEVKTLENGYQIGGEFITKLWGELWVKRIGYSAGVELMYPFYLSPDAPDLSAADKLNVNIFARMDFRFVEWFALSYEFKAVREAHLQTDFQIQNNILATFSYSLYKYVK